MEHPVEPDGEGDAYEEENERLRKQFSRQGVEHRAAGHNQPVVHRVVFYLRSDTEHGHHEDEQHEESRKDDVREIHIIVQPRVVDGVGVNHDGLQKGHRLSFRSAFGVEHRARGRPRSEFRHRAHVAIEQRAGHEVRIVRVERNDGKLLPLRLACGALRNIIEAVDVSALHRFACLRDVGILLLDARHFESIEVACQGTRRGGVVVVNQSERHVGRQTFRHQAGEENEAKQRSRNHAKPIDGLRSHPAQFATGYF